MTEPVCQLFYISTISRTLTMRDIEAILAASRNNNLRDGITGLLVQGGRRFLQVLEGNGREVDRTFARIRDDARHSAVVQLRVREVDHRAFPDWNMAYQKVRGPGEEDLIFIVGAMDEQLDDPLLRDELMGFAMLHNAA